LNELSNLSVTEIHQRLLSPLQPTHDVPTYQNDKALKKAAVLVPFVKQDDEWHLLFIKRSEHENDRHSGQVAFAGGRHEESDDSLEMTALREAHEEVGIEPEHVTVLGELNHHYSVSNYEITPIVATVPWPYDLTLQESEVAATFTIPLSWLANEDNYKLEKRQFDGVEIPVVYFKKYNNYLLWGATARMTLSLLTLLNVSETV
jgi:8-oxo-dGTP pyrophosphatase MutT (NUDIX family)